MTKKELLKNQIFQMMPDDSEIILDALGCHKVRTVRRGQTPRTGDKYVLILSVK